MGFYGTSAGVFSDLSLSFEVVVTILFLSGVWYGRRHLSLLHFKLMTLGFLFDFAFMVSYMVKKTLEGSTRFMGPEDVYATVYLPVVVFHSLISVAVLILAGYMVWFGYRYSNVLKERRAFESGERYKRHRKLGYATVAAWMLSFMSGVSVYALLYVMY